MAHGGGGSGSGEGALTHLDGRLAMVLVKDSQQSSSLEVSAALT
jgi:hypothetical protein